MKEARRLRVLSRALAFTAGFVLMACTVDVPPTPTYPELTYAHLGALRLDVAKIEVISQYTPPRKTPHVEHLMPDPPLAAAERWARDRLRPAGAAGVARFIVTDARVIEVPLERNAGLAGWFTTEQSERYDARLAVRLEVVDGQGARVGEVTAEAERSRTVPEDASVNDRQAMWFDLTDNLMRDLDATLEKNIGAYLKSYLR